MATDRSKIEKAAQDNGWEAETDGPLVTTFFKGQRSLNVTWDRDSQSYPVGAFYGMKRIRSLRLTRDIIGNLRK